LSPMAYWSMAVLNALFVLAQLLFHLLYDDVGGRQEILRLRSGHEVVLMLR